MMNQKAPYRYRNKVAKQLREELNRSGLVDLKD
jgi:hypothetical protein